MVPSQLRNLAVAPGTGHPGCMQQDARFQEIFRRVHARHPGCLLDEWISEPCADARGRPVSRPIVWSRRNGPWRRHDLVFVGAAPGNAGGKGSGELGAHGTRIPFGGDVAGANLDVLLGSIGISRNDTFLTATLNQLPEAGGGEPTLAEVQAPVGNYPSSLHLLRDTIVAAGPRLLVALGNVAIRAIIASAQLPNQRPPAAMPTFGRIEKLGIRRGELAEWPAGAPPAAPFRQRWTDAWGDASLPHLLLLTHPSAQNMSPFARVETAFHTRMLDARDALRAAVRDRLGWDPPAERPGEPVDGIYALPEWRELVRPRHQRLDALWREKGI